MNRFCIKLELNTGREQHPPLLSSPEPFALDPLLSPVTTMSNLANDKGSFSDPNGVDHRTSGGHGPLSAHTYVQGPSPLRKIGNPGPL